MTDTLRDKLIQKGWVTPFNAATLVRLIEDHYADEPAVPEEDREPATWTEGVCGDGAALLKDGVMVPIEAVVRELNEGARARAVLARWGNLKGSLTSSPPADGEVAETEPPLYARQTGTGQWEGADHPSGPWRKVLPADLARWSRPTPAPPADGEAAECAAELLQWQALVPVSERLPGSEDCDEQGRCWAGTRAFVDTRGDRDIDYPPSWELREVCAQDDVWLPAHDLPLPEVNNG